MFLVAFKYGMADPREIERMGSLVGDEQVARSFTIGTKAEDFIARMEKLIKAGFNHIYLQSTSPDEKAFIDLCAKEIVPYMRSTYGGTALEPGIPETMGISGNDLFY